MILSEIMSPQSRFRKKIIRPLASVKIAVLIIVSLSILVAIGTFVESKYDAFSARKLVYHTAWMFAIMITLAINLTAVMIDRLPWKRRHLPFILAHIGILILLAGSLVTWRHGLDGTMRIGVNESNRFVSVEATEVNLYASFDGESYTSMLAENQRAVDFFVNPPTPEKPFLVSQMEEPLKIIGYERYVTPERKVNAVEDSDRGVYGAAVRFQLFNKNANEIEWMVQKRPADSVVNSFGPALIHLGPIRRSAPVHEAQNTGSVGSLDFSDEKKFVNEAFLTPQENGQILLTVFNQRDEKPIKSILLKEGDVVDVGWMDLQIRLLRYLPKAKEEWDVQIRERPTDLTTSAIKLNFRGKDHWVLLNDVIKLFTDTTAYIFTYGQRRVDLGFSVQLDQFEMERYQGTNRAKEYRSFVSVPGQGRVEISMNEPMKHKGLIFYQASFQEDPATGEPIATILSVNYDPGRLLKYLVSLILSVGIILLFWFKKALAQTPQKEER